MQSAFPVAHYRGHSPLLCSDGLLRPRVGVAVALGLCGRVTAAQDGDALAERLALLQARRPLRLQLRLQRPQLRRCLDIGLQQQLRVRAQPLEPRFPGGRNQRRPLASGERAAAATNGYVWLLLGGLRWRSGGSFLRLRQASRGLRRPSRLPSSGTAAGAPQGLKRLGRRGLLAAFLAARLGHEDAAGKGAELTAGEGRARHPAGEGGRLERRAAGVHLRLHVQRQVQPHPLVQLVQHLLRRLVLRHRWRLGACGRPRARRPRPALFLVGS
mmetsp:Transcript_31223/g.78895  ORF Transcript_31223/g.78895 Transcript_31223/m.78895 type:complete len:271 (+) Transcript_31223:165-977(+)